MREAFRQIDARKLVVFPAALAAWSIFAIPLMFLLR